MVMHFASATDSTGGARGGEQRRGRETMALASVLVEEDSLLFDSSRNDELGGGARHDVANQGMCFDNLLDIEAFER